MSLFYSLGCFGFFMQCLVLTSAVDWGKYGPFTNDGPFEAPIVYPFLNVKKERPLPEGVDQMGTVFNLYTSKNPGKDNEKVLNDVMTKLELRNNNYNENEKTYFITHGWTGGPKKDQWPNDIKDALLKRDQNANVIIVGWERGANSKLYYQPVGNTRLVGAMVAHMIQALVNCFIEPNEKIAMEDRIHLIGFSLGAQVSGYAGQAYQKLTGRKVGRITGLDPAAPGFKDLDPLVRLDETDAKFVDVIHTNAPTVGTPTKSGMFDFWPNGGKNQPKCSIIDGEMFTCDHYRAHKLFTESIKSEGTCRFTAYESSNWNLIKNVNIKKDFKGRTVEMGFNAINFKDDDPGNFYLKTNGQQPFCDDKYEIMEQPKNDEAPNSVNQANQLQGFPPFNSTGQHQRRPYKALIWLRKKQVVRDPESRKRHMIRKKVMARIRRDLRNHA